MGRSIVGWRQACATAAYLVCCTSLHAADFNWIPKMLTKFQSDSKAFMKDPESVTKYDPTTGIPIRGRSRFSKESISTNDFVLEKDRARQKLVLSHQKISLKAKIGKNDRPEDLVDRLSLVTLQSMEDAHLKASAVLESPWSDDYWPVYLGGIARRYADPKFPASEDWKENIDYVNNNSCSVDQLSPAEKYDLVVGDRNQGLKSSVIKDGRSLYRSGGRKVEQWQGICDGWAAAAMMVPRPKQAVQVAAADGKNLITFYPSDIKALVSELWAQNDDLETRFIGGRCDDKHPKEDSNGRVLSRDCFDTNPGTWHLSVVNQVGVEKRSFILDSTYDYEVWNQPAYSYEYTYFNPKTLQPTEALEEAMIERRHFDKDKFSKYRSKNGVYLVGIAMKFVYVSETDPSTARSDSHEKDELEAVNYLYDLELDKNFKIIGGEWYQRQHPDFLWAPVAGSSPTTPGDKYLDENESPSSQWDGQMPIPSLWAKAARQSSRETQPLARIVRSLVKLSQTQSLE